MSLEMRTECERCGATLGPEAEAHICSFECTFCVACADDMQGRCPNCGGELVPRPKRERVADPEFAPGWAEPLDANWVRAIGEYFAARGDIARAYAVTSTYSELEGVSPQEELHIELLEPPAVVAPTELFRDVSAGIPKIPIAHASAHGPVARLTFTFTPQRLIEAVQASGELVWERTS